MRPHRLRLPGELQVAITEKAPAFLWRTSRAVLAGARDGTIIAELGRSEALLGDLRRLPLVEDERFVSRLLLVGDAVPPAELRAAKRLSALDPRLIGSKASTLIVKVDHQLGFVLESAQPAWTAAMGFYQLDPARTRPRPTLAWSSSWRRSGPCWRPGRSATCRGWMPATRGRYIGRRRARDGTDHGPSGVQNRRECGL